MGKRLNYLRFDRGGEFISNEFNIFCNDRGIKRHMFIPRTPPHNGIPKRKNRYIMDCGRTLMMQKHVSQNYWRKYVNMTIYTLNQVQVKKGINTTHFELWYGYAYNVKYFKKIGIKCYIL